jgi:hypothetical protein
VLAVLVFMAALIGLTVWIGQHIDPAPYKRPPPVDLVSPTA